MYKEFGYTKPDMVKLISTAMKLSGIKINTKSIKDFVYGDSVLIDREKAFYILQLERCWSKSLLEGFSVSTALVKELLVLLEGCADYSRIGVFTEKLNNLLKSDEALDVERFAMSVLLLVCEISGDINMTMAGVVVANKILVEAGIGYISSVKTDFYEFKRIINSGNMEDLCNVLIHRWGCGVGA